MRPLFAFALATLLPLALAAAKPAAAEKPSPEKKVRLLLELTGAETLTNQMIEGMLQSYQDPVFAARFRAEAQKDDLLSRFVPVYLKHLSEADLDAAIAFYQSPAGKHMVAAQPLIVQESQTIGQEWENDINRRASQPEASPSPTPHP